MQWRAIFHLGHRMAQRNNLFLFAWLCALALPLLLQLIIAMTEEFRDYLADFFGVASLYMVFTMTYGFATVFISYYQASSYRKAGTLDLLRTANFKPLAVLYGVSLQLQAILGPPVIVFCVGLIVYALVDQNSRGWFRGMTVIDGLGLVLLLLLIQATLSTVPLLGLFRRGELLALACLPVVLPLNAIPLFAGRSRGTIGVISLVVLLAVFALLWGLALANLARLWPPQKR